MKKKYYAIINGKEELVRTSNNDYKYACVYLNIFTSKDKNYLLNKVKYECYLIYNELLKNKCHVIYDVDNSKMAKLNSIEWSNLKAKKLIECTQKYEKALETVADVYTK